jgi:hypothetical protein
LNGARLYNCKYRQRTQKGILVQLEPYQIQKLELNKRFYFTHDADLDQGILLNGSKDKRLTSNSNKSADLSSQQDQSQGKDVDARERSAARALN